MGGRREGVRDEKRKQSEEGKEKGELGGWGIRIREKTVDYSFHSLTLRTYSEVLLKSWSTVRMLVRKYRTS